MKDTQQEIDLASLFGCLTIFIISPIVGILRAYVATRLWLWFIVSQFHIAPISIPVAYGLLCLAALPQTTPAQSKAEPITSVADSLSKLFEALMLMFLPILIVWFCGYIAHCFVH